MNFISFLLLYLYLILFLGFGSIAIYTQFEHERNVSLWSYIKVFFINGIKSPYILITSKIKSSQDPDNITVIFELTLYEKQN